MRKECKTCHSLLREWKCAECSPNASIFHVGQHSSIKFCEDYCHAVFFHCKDIPFDIKNKDKDKIFYLNDRAKTAGEWCKGRTQKAPNCFRGNIPRNEDKDSNCKCPDHTCHELEEDLWEEDKDEL